MADDLIKLNMGYDFKSDKPYDWAKKARGEAEVVTKVDLFFPPGLLRCD